MIRTDIIYLRALELNDLEFIYKLENETTLWQYGTTIAPIARDTIRDFIKRSNTYDIYTLKQMRLIICKSDDNTEVGCIDITDFDPKNLRATLGIVIAEGHRNHGFADEALKLVINYTFKILNIKQLYCEIDATNINSINLFTNNGFVLTGTKRNWLLSGDGKWHDVSFYQKFNDSASW